MFSLQCWVATSWFKARARRASPAVLLLMSVVSLGSPEAPCAVPTRFDRLGLDDGLSQQAVRVIAQDKQGFMWFGTEDGLDRFDGYAFEHVRQARDASSLPDAFITDIKVDPTGRLWVARITRGGPGAFRFPHRAARTLPPREGPSRQFE
jgi:two component regulator with propeller domain